MYGSNHLKMSYSLLCHQCILKRTQPVYWRFGDYILVPFGAVRFRWSGDGWTHKILAIWPVQIDSPDPTNASDRQIERCLFKTVAQIQKSKGTFSNRNEGRGWKPGWIGETLDGKQVKCGTTLLTRCNDGQVDQEKKEERLPEQEAAQELSFRHEAFHCNGHRTDWSASKIWTTWV